MFLIKSLRATLRFHHIPTRRLTIMTNTITTASAASRPKVLIITGPTAVGKTNVSLDLAERFGGEIISADSVQVYKGLDIGSDKVCIYFQPLRSKV